MPRDQFYRYNAYSDQSLNLNSPPSIIDQQVEDDASSVTSSRRSSPARSINMDVTGSRRCESCRVLLPQHFGYFDLGPKKCSSCQESDMRRDYMDIFGVRRRQRGLSPTGVVVPLSADQDQTTTSHDQPGTSAGTSFAVKRPATDKASENGKSAENAPSSKICKIMTSGSCSALARQTRNCQVKKQNALSKLGLAGDKYTAACDKAKKEHDDAVKQFEQEWGEIEKQEETINNQIKDTAGIKSNAE